MADIENMLEEVSGALAMNIDARIFPSSPWLRLIEKKPWEDEIGKTFDTLKVERGEVVADGGWRTQAVPTGTGPAPCIPPLTTVRFNSSRQAVTLVARAVESLDLCIEDLRSKWKRKEQMKLAEDSLVEVIRNIWIDHYRDQYFTNCDRKVVLATGLPTTNAAAGDTWSTTAATSPLTNDVLDSLYMYLMREGAGEHAYSMQGGEYIFLLVVSHETSKFLRNQDDAVKEDYRESSRSDERLRGIGFTPTHSYNGFVHITDPTPRRFTHGGPDYDAQVAPFYKDGNDKIVQNPAYEAATFEDSAIFVKSVYECLVPPSISSISKAEFDPQNYIGDIKWKNYPDKVENPDGTIGNYRAVLQSGIRPRMVEFGIGIRHLRCVGEGLIACP
ncbi:MAG: hypothetical protein KJO69_08800 [Gammaproteobacteria bacterium]|nr:hypothetical protein [Gammaproteobacteria bacterium]